MIEVDFSQAIERLQKIVDDLVRTIPSLVVALVVFALFLLISNVVRILVFRYAERSRRRRNFALVMGRVTQWFIVVLGFLIGAVIVFPNFSPAELIQLLGLGSVAVGFAFRDVLQNFLVGLLILWNEPFRIGDQVTIADYEGTVENIDSRATSIRTYDGRRIVIPNNDMYIKGVTVNTAFERRRIDEDIRIAFDSDITQAKALILEAIEESGAEERLTSPPPDVLVISVDEYMITLRMRWWISPPLQNNFLKSRDLILTAVMNKLTASDQVRIPYPTYNIMFPNQTESQ